MFPELDLDGTDPAQHLRTAGDDLGLDDLSADDISARADLSVHDLSVHDPSVRCVEGLRFFGRSPAVKAPPDVRCHSVFVKYGDSSRGK